MSDPNLKEAIIGSSSSGLSSPTSRLNLVDQVTEEPLSYSDVNTRLQVHLDRPAISGKDLQMMVNSLLRPTEHCQTCCEVLYTGSKLVREHRILALITSSESGLEESCIFLLKSNAPRTVTIRLTLPIYNDFKMSIAQSKPVNLDDESSIVESKNELVIKLKSYLSEMTLELKSLDQLQSLITEVKRLTQLAVNQNYRPDGNSHAWVNYYTSNKPTSPIGTLNSNLTKQLMSPMSPYTKVSEMTSLNEVVLNPLVMASPILDKEGLEDVNKARLRNIKEQWVSKQMRVREAQFTTYSHINLLIGSWNVNGKYATQSLKPWLINENYPLPDIIVLGFQELDLSAEAFLVHDTSREDEWCTNIVAGLGDNADKFTKLVAKQLVGMFLVIYVRTDQLMYFSDIGTDSAGVGIMGMMGNKGAVAIRLKYKDSYLCFINSHLAADSSQVDRRNQDFQDICRRIGFQSNNTNPMLPVGYGFDHSSPIYKTQAMTLPRNPKLNCIFDNDHIVWLGDLNYRISLPHDKVLSCLSTNDYETLLTFDQLKLQQLKNNAFQEFQEGPITFPPTYKYDIGTNNFDSSEKKRIPSYCDRILWRSIGGNSDHDVIEQNYYTSHPTLISSDHKPISSLFKLRTKTLDLAQFQEVYSLMIRELDKFENQIMPDATISTNQLSFGRIGYLKSKELSLTIENSGQVYLQFQFIAKMDEINICKNWLWVNPSNGVIMPGEKLRVNFIMLVDRRSAPNLNMGLESLEDILILHLVHGKDYFISINGQYQSTCFAVELEYLARLPRPIRQVKNKDDLYPKENAVSVPLVMWRIVDFIYQYGMEVDGIFLTPGDQDLMVYIRECLDTGEEFSLDKLLVEQTTQPNINHDLMDRFEPPPILPISQPTNLGIHSMAETLIRFLEALPTPIIPFHLYDLCLEAAVLGKEAAVQALETMPRIHLNTFLYILSLIKEVIGHQGDQDGLLLEKLAMVFASVLLRKEKDFTERYDSTLQKKKFFLMLFLINTTEL